MCGKCNLRGKSVQCLRGNGSDGCVCCRVHGNVCGVCVCGVCLVNLYCRNMLAVCLDIVLCLSVCVV